MEREEQEQKQKQQLEAEAEAKAKEKANEQEERIEAAEKQARANAKIEANLHVAQARAKSEQKAKLEAGNNNNYNLLLRNTILSVHTNFAAELVKCAVTLAHTYACLMSHASHVLHVQHDDSKSAVRFCCNSSSTTPRGWLCHCRKIGRDCWWK